MYEIFIYVSAIDNERVGGNINDWTERNEPPITKDTPHIANPGELAHFAPGTENSVRLCSLPRPAGQ